MKGFGLVPGVTLPCTFFLQVAEDSTGGRTAAEQDKVFIPHTPCSDMTLQSPAGTKVREKSGVPLTEPVSHRETCVRQSDSS